MTPARYPHIILGKKAINRLAKLPCTPPREKKGEKRKEVMFGDRVLLIKEDSPKTNPTIAPSFLPNSIPAAITGRCKVVALINPRGIYPSKGTVATMISIVISSVNVVKRFIFFINVHQ